MRYVVTKKNGNRKDIVLYGLQSIYPQNSLEKKILPEKIKTALKKYGVPPELLEVEITESSMTNVHETFSILTELKQLGVYVSVDDFGTGYSSLSYLKRYPIDIIKIDQSFIADIAKDDKMKPS